MTPEQETIKRMAVTIACYRQELTETIGDDYALPEIISDTEQHLRSEDKDVIDEVPGDYLSALAWIEGSKEGG